MKLDAIPIRFRGSRRPEGCLVAVEWSDGRSSRLRHDVRHSPTGFEWGYHGSGPADLARSLCAAVLGEVPDARIYQRVKRELVASLTGDTWTLTRGQVLDVIARAVEVTAYGVAPVERPQVPESDADQSGTTEEPTGSAT